MPGAMFVSPNNTNTMENLIKKLAAIEGITEDMLVEVVFIVSAHMKAQFPFLHGPEDSILETEDVFITNEGSACTELRKDLFVYN